MKLSKTIRKITKRDETRTDNRISKKKKKGEKIKER